MLSSWTTTAFKYESSPRFPTSGANIVLIEEFPANGAPELQASIFAVPFPMTPYIHNQAIYQTSVNSPPKNVNRVISCAQDPSASDCMSKALLWTTIQLTAVFIPPVPRPIHASTYHDHAACSRRYRKRITCIIDILAAPVTLPSNYLFYLSHPIPHFPLPPLIDRAPPNLKNHRIAPGITNKQNHPPWQPIFQARFSRPWAMLLRSR